MTNKSFLFIVLLFSFHMSAQKTVEVANSSINYIKVIEVQNTQAWTEIMLEFNPVEPVNATLHAPSGTSPFVLSDQKGNRYALTGQTGWNGPDNAGFGAIKLTAGQKKYVKLFFNKLKNINDIYSLTEVNCEGNGCWNFYNIKLKDKKTPLPPVEDNVIAKIDSTWVDYDITENGAYGMKIHLKFNVHNMKDSKCTLTVRFMNEKEEFLKTTNVPYSNKSGHIALFSYLTPLYNNTLYRDVTFFMPYNEFQLPKGVYNLKFDVDFLGKEGTGIKHLALYNFRYTKN